MIPRDFLVLTLPILLLNSQSCYGYKGLFVMTLGTKSHIYFFEGIMKALVESGHEMTFISPFETKLSHENFTQITTDDEYNNKILQNLFTTSNTALFQNVLELFPNLCVSALSDPQVLETLKEKYDYVIMCLLSTECFLDHIYQNKIPFIYASTNTMMNPYGKRLGAPELTSISPNFIASLSYPFTYWERVLSTIVDLLLDFSTSLSVSRMEKLSRELKLWSPDTPSIFELQNEASLAFINSIRPLENPIRSTPPTLIYAGAIHIQPTKPLPTDLEEWFNGSGDAGFILFSLGTGAKPSEMKKEHLQSIINVFRSLKQRIIWKWDSKEMKDLPPNVKLAPWLPQQDILAHPKIRLFITHGGLFSTQEAMYHGVPVIGMPVFGDQMSNVKDVVRDGWGAEVKWTELTEDKLRSVILDTLTNSSIRQAVNRRSNLNKDWPTTPSEEVVYWTEYVIRHNGAKHLQSPLVHMTWYQIHNLDVWAFLLLTCLFVIFIVLLILKFSFNFIKRKLFKVKRE